MTKKSQHELDLEAELKGLLSGSLSAVDVLRPTRGPDPDEEELYAVWVSQQAARAQPGLKQDLAAGLEPRPTRMAPELAAPYGEQQNHDCRDSYAQIAAMLERIESRTVRMETRITNTMRYLGFPPRAPYTGTPMGRAVWADGDIVVTGNNVPIRDLSWLASRHSPDRDVRVILNNVLWATLHIHPKASNGYEERVGE